MKAEPSTPLTIVVLGLSISSAWGNGHATTYRALLRGLRALGNRILFLERDVPWYADHRDLPEPDFCTLEYYRDIAGLRRFLPAIRGADAVVVGSYVPEGTEVIDLLAAQGLSKFCFYDIDTPVTVAKLDAGDEEFIAPRQVPLFDLYFSFAGGEVLDKLERKYGAQRALPLYCSVDPSRYFHTGEAKEWDLGYLGTYSPDRQPTLERLLIEPARRLPDRRFVVAGPQYPPDIDWPDNVDRIEHLPPTEHASFYSRLRFALNVTRSDMIACGWSPSVRLFEAAACSTPVISDRWRGLTDIFPEGEAILTAGGGDDVVELLTTLPDHRRTRISQAAHRCVLDRHTGEARARQLVEYLCPRSERSETGRPVETIV